MPILDGVLLYLTALHAGLDTVAHFPITVKFMCLCCQTFEIWVHEHHDPLAGEQMRMAATQSSTALPHFFHACSSKTG